MKRRIKVATIQPPIPKGEKGGIITHNEMIEKGLSFLEEVGREKADIVCLPEIFNVFGLSSEEALKKASSGDGVFDKVCRIAKRYEMRVVYSALEQRRKKFYISASIIDGKGRVIGKYDKTHPTRAEKKKLQVTPGNKYPVFKTDIGRIGVMICYDCYFPEVARILTLKGAEIIFYPALQRHFPETYFEIQTRARALDYSVYVVRSSYGVVEGQVWNPGMMIGRSCIIDRDGTIVTDLGHKAGMITAKIDLKNPRLMEGPGGMGRVDIRKFMLEDRRPETYGDILSP